jgi:cell division protein ZapA (FtsZ GTPase activity inhibitor)
MNKIIATGIFTFLSFFVTATNAQFGALGSLLGGASSAASGGGVDAQVKSFVESSNQINSLIFTSLMAINAAYSSAEESAKISSEVKAFTEITDPKERAAKVAEAQKTQTAKLEELIKSKDAVERTQKLDTTKRKQVLDSVGNFAIAGLQAVKLTATGKSIVSSVTTNPMALIQIAPVADALPILASAVSTTTDVLPGYYKILRGANLEPPKVTAESKPQEVKF